MSSLPLDLALAVAAAGVDIERADDQLEAALRSAIADRRGYLGDVVMIDAGYRVELLAPIRDAFEGRTVAVALAWCLVFLMGDTGELGIGGFSA